MDTQLPPDLDAAVSRVRHAIAFVERRAINRGEVIKKIFCALLTREHVLLQSRTGVGKSLLANQIYGLFDGAQIFHVQASKEQQPDTYFGALDLEELKRGRIIHNTEGSLVEADLGFIDEIFDANDYTLRALLTVLNERRLVRGLQNVPSPIHTVIAAANYTRVTEVTEAILDRFLYKAVIQPDRDPFFMYRISQQFVLHRGQIAEPEERMPYATLKRLSNVVRGHDPDVTITVPESTLFFANLVLRHYESLHRQHNRQQGLGPESGREHQLFKKAYESLSNHYETSHAFEQLASLLELQDLLDRIQDDATLLDHPIERLADTPVKLSLIEWAKEKLGLGETGPEHNRRLLTAYLEGITPLTDEIRSLKRRLHDEVVDLFEHDETWN